MNREQVYNALIDEKKFPYEKMTIEERNYCLNIIKSCKDISDSDIKVGTNGKCELVYLHFIKNDQYVHVNGCISIGENSNKENRCLDAKIYFKDNKIVVQMQITRLCVNDIKNKEYTVIDEFTLENNEINRVSKYNYQKKKKIDNVENEEMKGRLR